MNSVSRSVSWILALPALVLGLSSAFANGPQAPHAPRQQASLGPAVGASGASAAPADDIKSVYIIPRKYKGSDADAALIRSGEVESIEVRFNLTQARLRGSLYFEAIHHKKGRPDEFLGGNTYQVRNPDGSTSLHKGLNYDDYQYSTGLLKKDFDHMWGNYIYLRDGASVLATGGTIYLTWRLATVLSEREILGLSFLAGKAVELYKSKIGFAIMIYPTYLAVKQVYNFYNMAQNNGKGVPLWNGFKGQEAAERDWLFRVLSQSYENARYGTPIDEKQFDEEAAYNRYTQALHNQQVDMPQGNTDGSSNAAADTPLPAINTVPMKKDLSFALTAFQHFFSDYVEDNAEDDMPDTGAMPR